MKAFVWKYWLIFAIALVLAAIVGMSQYAESKFVTFPEGVGAWAVILTLLAILWQSIETRAAAKATESSVAASLKQAALMKRQIDVGINKERARIFVQQVPANWTFLTADYERVITEHRNFAPMCMEIDSFKISMTNEGESTAYNAVCTISVTVVEGHTGKVLLTETRETLIDRFRQDAKPIADGIDFFPCLAPEILDPIHASQAVLRLFGTIRYEDAFDPENLHVTPFCFEWQVTGEYLEHVGPDREGQYIDQSGWIDKSGKPT